MEKTGNKKYCISLLEDFCPQAWGVVHQCPKPAGGAEVCWSSGEGGCVQGPGLGGKNGVRCPWFCQLRPSVAGHLGGLPVGRLVGRLDEHGLGEVLACGHGDLLDLVELL